MLRILSVPVADRPAPFHPLLCWPGAFRLPKQQPHGHGIDTYLTAC